MNLVVFRIILLVVGYLFGLIQTAYIVGKANGIDIREHGSGNSGTTNALRVLGKKAGLMVFIGDVLKTFIPVMIISLLWKYTDLYKCFDLGKYEDNYKSLGYLWKLYIGFGVVLGHNFPVHMGFKGGKGIASTSGMILGFHGLYVPVGLVLFFGTFALTNYVSLGSIILMIGFFAQMLIFGLNKLFFFKNMLDSQMIEMFIVTGCISGLGLFRHRANMVRLIKGNERKTYLFKKNKAD